MKEKINKPENFKDRYLEDIIAQFGEKFGEENIKKLYDRHMIIYKNYKTYANKLIEFTKKLTEKYSEEQKYLKSLAYHILIGSTPEPDSIEFFDFEGEDSIMQFCENLIKTTPPSGEEQKLKS
jgi:hypothetical protein